VTRREEKELRKREQIAKQRARLGQTIHTTQKTPRISEEINSDLQTVQWCFRLFDANKDWRPSQVDDLGFREVGAHCKNYSQRTWGEISANGKRDHAVLCTELRHEVKKRLGELRLDDVDELWTFHFTSKLRLWGIRDGRVFVVLWLDPEHLVWPTEKKNT
jgi:hypothetical protein